MLRYLFALTVLLSCSFLPARAQQSGRPSAPGVAKPSLALGISVGGVPELLYEHLRLPNLKRGQGVVIHTIAPDSPAASSGLQPNDIVLSCDGTQVQNGEHFARLLRATAPQGKSHVLLVRGGKEMRVRVRLTAPLGMDTPAPPAFEKALLKPGGPPAISVKAEPLEGGKLQITFRFYSDGKGKLDQVICSGSFKEIQAQVRSLGEHNQIPPRVQELVDVALKRIRDLNDQ
jgi:membrane-associated protease RseP (regulator of RpoE activity)